MVAVITITIVRERIGNGVFFCHIVFSVTICVDCVCVLFESVFLRVRCVCVLLLLLLLFLAADCEFGVHIFVVDGLPLFC